MLRDALMQISRGKYNGSTQLSHLKPSITKGLPLGRTEIPETKSPSVFLPPCQPSALPPLGSSQGLRAQDLSSSKPELSQLGFTPLYTHCNSGSAFCRKDFLRMQIHHGHFCTSSANTSGNLLRNGDIPSDNSY